MNLRIVVECSGLYKTPQGPVPALSYHTWYPTETRVRTVPGLYGQRVRRCPETGSEGTHGTVLRVRRKEKGMVCRRTDPCNDLGCQGRSLIRESQTTHLVDYCNLSPYNSSSLRPKAPKPFFHFLYLSLVVYVWSHPSPQTVFFPFCPDLDQD